LRLGNGSPLRQCSRRGAARLVADAILQATLLFTASPRRPTQDNDELELQGGHVYLPWGPAATSRRAVSRLGPWPSSTPAKRQPLRRMRAAFGFIEVLEVVHHDDG
jgi:hypothetical protein